MMKTNINLTKEVQVEVMSLVHIGAAQEQFLKKNIDYFYEDETLYYIDFNDLLEAVQEKGERFDTVSNLIATNRGNDLKKYLFDRLKIDIMGLAYKMESFRNEPDNEIRTFIRDGLGAPYIPGSSIKGAIKSVLFRYLHQKNDRRDKERREADHRSINNYDQKLFGSFDNSIMRYIRVGDANFEAKDLETNFVELFNLYRDGDYWESDWKDFNVTLQNLRKGATGTFRLDLAKPLLEAIQSSKTIKANELPPANARNIVTATEPFVKLKKIINEHTRYHLEKEIKFFEKYNQIDEAIDIIGNLKELMRVTMSEDSCLLRMGHGSGFHAITGDWRFSNHTNTITTPDGRNRYKSRKIVNGDQLMGFVKLTF